MPGASVRLVPGSYATMMRDTSPSSPADGVAPTVADGGLDPAAFSAETVKP